MLVTGTIRLLMPSPPYFKCLSFLFQGARVDIKNNEGRLPLELTKDPECAALIKQAGNTVHPIG